MLRAAVSRSACLDRAAPELAVRQHEEHLRVLRAAVHLLVPLHHAEAPVDAELEVRVPRRVLLDAEGRLLVEMIEKEEKRVGIGGQTDLRRGDVGEHGKRDPVAPPAERITQQPEELHRSLPAIALHVLDPHRRGGILEDDEVDAAQPHRRCRTVWPGGRDDQAARGADEEEPEREIAGKAEPLANRDDPAEASRCASARRRAKRRIQSPISTAGHTSSHR